MDDEKIISNTPLSAAEIVLIIRLFSQTKELTSDDRQDLIMELTSISRENEDRQKIRFTALLSKIPNALMVLEEKKAIASKMPNNELAVKSIERLIALFK